MELLYAIQCFSSSIFWFGQEHCGQGKWRPHIKTLTCFVPWGTVQDRTLLVLAKRPIYSESTL